MPLEQIEEQKTLSASSDAGYDLYKVAVLCSYQLVQQCFALDGHGVPPIFKFVENSEKMKTEVAYHKFGSEATHHFQLYGKIQKVESSGHGANRANR